MSLVLGRAGELLNKGKKTMRSATKLVVVSSCWVLAAADVAAASDWPNFRGPRHDGISDFTGLKTSWDGPMPLVWNKNVGSAFSSFACVGDKVYTCGTQDGGQVLYCLQADTGDVVWQQRIEKEYRESNGDGTRATPTVDQGRVYILGAHGALVCFEAGTGKKVWSTRFSRPPQWGYSGSVLIEGDLAVATGRTGLVAFNKATGEQVWQTGDDQAGYATPYPFTFNQKRYIVGFTSQSAIVVEAKTGKQVLRLPWKTDWDINAAAPIVHDGYLFLTSGYSTGCALFKLRADGDRLAADQVWRSKVLMNKFQSCILHEGKLYSSDQRALVCADFLTGKEQWRVYRVKHGTMVLADGHLLLLTQDGKLKIAPVSPKGFDVRTEAEILTGRCWSVPVLHRGRLYARNMDRLVCFDLTR
ncbi:MAG: PQQ-binding-like beta-propeller repeat protein [bacterium]|nr:PQQ-binding-like beta-propeller repeat protein [bacterium]